MLYVINDHVYAMEFLFILGLWAFVVAWGRVPVVTSVEARGR